ncbi:hypothetical protein FQN57_000344 [Myotisia sp. PD_48]|nr:hypothetical protein FQN57_000344 [Myotisia sp. PD_48]
MAAANSQRSQRTRESEKRFLETVAEHYSAGERQFVPFLFDPNVQIPESFSPADSVAASAVSSSQYAANRRQSYDTLYDATDESDMDRCPSLSSNSDTRASTASSAFISNSSATSTSIENPTRRRNRYPILTIPPTTFNTINFHHKCSPVPPTPPPKIPLSPMVLARLQKRAPALQAPPSLASSALSERPSTLSTPQTPDMDAVSDVDWNAQHIHVQADMDSSRESVTSSAPMSPQIDIQLEQPEDWSMLLEGFPVVPCQNVLRARTASVAESLESSSRSGFGPDDDIRLPDTAMQTLQHIKVHGNCSSSSSASERDESTDEEEMQLVKKAETRSYAGSIVASTTASSFSSLSIPSPGGFFASLTGQSRRTWSFTPAMPTTAIAESFYDCPWRPQQDTIVEQVLEYNRMHEEDGEEEEDGGTEGPPTAKAIVVSPPQTARKVPADLSRLRTQCNDTHASSTVAGEYDELYERQLKSRAIASLDRTSVWLAAQTQYLAALSEANPANANVEPNDRVDACLEDRDRSPPVSGPKKSVKFLEPIQEEANGMKPAPLTPLPPLPTPVVKDSIFYRGFQYINKAVKVEGQDTFLYSHIRYEKIQAVRLSMKHKHVDYLAGTYNLETPTRPPYRGPFSQAPRNSIIPQILANKDMYHKVEKEQDVLNQVKNSVWAINSLIFLNGNRLIPSPAALRLANAKGPLGNHQMSEKRRVRVLDLGGQTACEWAWHVSTEYPNVKVYTVVTKQQTINRHLKGPPNHRTVSVPYLWSLPFPDNHFDLISARTLHLLLKATVRSVGPDGEQVDEFDLCLKECFRCLKPGGYFEFLIIDSDIVRAGPYSSATSVEFGFNLKTRGYDPYPTKNFLGKLKRSNFGAIKRAWLFMPMGSPVCIESPIPGNQGNANMSKTGSTADVASITGLLGGWMWEQWMLKLQVEMGREDARLLEEMAAVFEEGRKVGAGWRCLNGWAMKPRKLSQR